MDEKSKQLLKETRLPIRGKNGIRSDYEYERNGTADIFMVVEPKGEKRTVWVTRNGQKRGQRILSDTSSWRNTKLRKK